MLCILGKTIEVTPTRTISFHYITCNDYTNVHLSIKVEVSICNVVMMADNRQFMITQAHFGKYQISQKSPATAGFISIQ